MSAQTQIMRPILGSFGKDDMSFNISRSLTNNSKKNKKRKNNKNGKT